MPHAPGQWSSFGGGRHRNESAWENAAREAIEETFGGRGKLDEPNFHVTRQTRTMIPFIYEFASYVVEVREPPVGWPRANSEHDAIQWFAVGGLPQPLHPQAKALIRKVPRT
jgi:8-oxo-dGTP pyrophosphatase MutT (NUDIX family)